MHNKCKIIKKNDEICCDEENTYDRIMIVRIGRDVYMKKNKKKKEQAKKRRLLLSLLLLVGTGIFLGTSTYAWFTANQTVAVNPIDVNVAAQSGLQISADGQNWKSILTTTDITSASGTYAAAKNQLPTQLAPVSSAGIMNADGTMEMFLGEVNSDEDSGNFVLAATKETDANGTTGNYVVYDMFLRTETAGPVYLTTSSGIEFDTTDNGIKNATRVAFAVLGNTTSDDTIGNIQGLNAGTSAPVTIWEPNMDAHTSYGVANARDTYGIDDLTAGTGNEAVPYDGIKLGFGADQGITLGNANATDAGTYFQAVTPQIQTEVDFTEYKQLVNLSKGVTKIRVYFWIEGQDVDCENNASGGNITFNLQISRNASADGA